MPLFVFLISPASPSLNLMLSRFFGREEEEEEGVEVLFVCRRIPFELAVELEFEFTGPGVDEANLIFNFIKPQSYFSGNSAASLF
jgi:hypothetical protein